MNGPSRVTLPGQVRGLATPEPAGPLFVTAYAGSDVGTTVLTALDPAGTVLWQRTFDGHPGPPRGTPGGTVWIAQERTLVEVGSDGAVVRSTVPRHEPHEHLGAFVVLPDGFCVLWLPARPRHVMTVSRIARVARYTWTGHPVWSTPLPVDEISYPGVVGVGVHTGGRIRPRPPWRPRTLQADVTRQPLLVSADRVLAGVRCGSSGIGVCVTLDTATGEVVAVAPPAPSHEKAIAGPGSFVTGWHGDGRFSTALVDRAGGVRQTWPAYAMLLVDRHGAIRGAEMKSPVPSDSRFRVFEPDGTLRDGPPLADFHTTYPALDTEGTAVFWRAGGLMTVDRDLRARILYRDDDDRAVMSRVLLLDAGRVVFALDDELLTFRGTGLAGLDAGPWPCADGNLLGNPVL